MRKKQVARIKHKGSQGYNSNRRGRERDGMEHDIQNRERSTRRNRHVISVCWKSGGNECEAYEIAYENLGIAYMYTVHIRIEGSGGKSVESQNQEMVSQRLSLLRFARLEVKYDSQQRQGWKGIGDKV